MARRKRRNEDAVDKRLDRDSDEALDEAAEDDAALDDDLDGGSESADDKPARRGGTAVKRAKADTKARAKSNTRPSGKGDKEKAKKKRPERVGLFGRLARFIREVVAELRKVVWPTRKELLTYSVVVIVFVTVMVAIIAGMDYGFGKAMLFVFGNENSE